MQNTGTKILNCDKIQYRILRACYRWAPFDLRGGLLPQQNLPRTNIVSCLIVSNKLLLLEGLLSSLTQQTLSKDDFEVVVVFDWPGKEVLVLVEEYKEYLNIRLHQITQPVRILSDLRNLSVSLSSGEFLLFLDDDTRILQKDYLKSALAIFHESNADVLIPQAGALFGILRTHYDFLDRFSFAGRCSFYRRKTLEELGGFLTGLYAYEDIELSIRLMMKKPRVVLAESLNYYHPPLYFDSMRKPLAIGQAIFQMRQHYSFFVWLLVYINALRFLPYGLIPGQRYRHWFKISLGVLLYPLTGKSYYY